ncbi:MAG: barstar family protein [Oscillospiraceae bacterium]|nr:barstar family protein [Oscillospiraceae bacterium]
MSYNEEYNSFKEITENPIVLDFEGCHNLGEIHLILKEKCGLPEYYGENLDALWDCLDGRFEGEVLVEVRGYASLSEELKSTLLQIFDMFQDLEKENTEFRFNIVS